MAPRGSRRAGIIEAAARLIREEGVHETSISEIIRESGSSTGTIYHHFANKNEIVLAVAYQAVVEPLQRILAAYADRGLSPAEMFRGVVDNVITGEVQSALIIQLWAGSSQDPQLKEVLREHLGDVRIAMVRRLTVWLAEQGDADAEARAEILATVTMGQAMGLLAQRTLMPDLDQAAYVEQACHLLDQAALPRT